MPPERLMYRKVSMKLDGMQRDVTTRSKQKGIIKKIDEIGEIGAPYYTPHVEVLATMQNQPVLT